MSLTRKLLTFYIFISLSPSLGAQSYIYQIEWKGDSVGNMIVNKKVVENRDVYSIKSNVSVSFILGFDIASEYESVYSNGILVEAKTHHTLNDKTRSKSAVTKTASGYLVIVDDEKKNVDDIDIRESITTLYFQLPTSDQIFSERFGTWCKLDNTGVNEYTLHKPDGKKNLYRYRDNKCIEAEIHTAFITIKVRRLD